MVADVGRAGIRVEEEDLRAADSESSESVRAREDGFDGSFALGGEASRGIWETDPFGEYDDIGGLVKKIADVDGLCPSSAPPSAFMFGMYVKPAENLNCASASYGKGGTPTFDLVVVAVVAAAAGWLIVTAECEIDRCPC